ncbi:MAG TPA: long-chain fatty acid--CoA ligase [Ignavibacteria bacterium]|nr:long-chain fatty acid--CoA ligase [Bacteroidota bacterium]HRI85282.1 long-chain fatty acid--CoA ligase [Ignavibacteria bacterium]HRJ99320.1 long-chain fatty acid--CoA ligase [Ignavibacteria bacterium]
MLNTLADLFFNRIKNMDYGKNIFYTKVNDEYIPYKLNEFLKDIYKVIIYFRSAGIEKGDRISIISENRTEWAAVDFACIFMNVITVPVYTSLSGQQTEYILKDSASKICFVSNSFQLEKLLMQKANLPDLKEIVVFNEIDPQKYQSAGIKKFQDIINSNINTSETEIIEYLSSVSSHIKNRDLVTIIYTSGTTGIPKGVMLSHKNLSSNIQSCKEVLTIDESDRFLSYLPYSHAYERVAGYYLAFFSGAEIYFAQSIDTLSVQLKEVKPTIVITVPRLLDKIYNRLMKSSETMNSTLQKNIFLWAVNLAKSKNANRNSLKWKLADNLVFKKIRDRTGNCIRFFVSGGGALNKNTGEFFDNVGIMILEGYGLTETSPVISVNHPDHNKYGTVGKPINGVEVRLTAENEIIVKGDLVMEGYYKDEASTSDVIQNRWLFTGDIGEIDSDGFLKITDRKKALFKSSGGKYISPTQIEEIVSHLPYIENLIVIGNERMYVTALISPEKSELTAFAGKNGITFNSYSELLNDKKLIKLIQKEIDSAQKELSNYERIRKFKLIEKPFTIETGELTPTMKVKRNFVSKLYEKEIEEMYVNAD